MSFREEKMRAKAALLDAAAQEVGFWYHDEDDTNAECRKEAYHAAQSELQDQLHAWAIRITR